MVDRKQCIKKQDLLEVEKYNQGLNPKKVPPCPYSLKTCENFDTVLQRGVCQSHGNRYSKSIRCSSLPRWVKDGFHIAVLRGGHLCV